MNCCDEKTEHDSQATGVMAWVTGPRRWWLFAAVAVVASLALGWEQLVLLGIAPLLISLLPCLVMCALGLCMTKCKDKKTAATGEKADAAVARVKNDVAATSVVSAGERVS